MPSQAIRSFAYDASRNELTVTFASGRGYVYSLVSPAVAAALAASGSKGVFHNAHIRDRYPFRKLKAALVQTAQPSLREALRASTESANGAETAPQPVRNG
ncbi:MAG: KTSC domain-containing protein [Bauldia sp.]